METAVPQNGEGTTGQQGWFVFLHVDVSFCSVLKPSQPPVEHRSRTICCLGDLYASEQARTTGAKRVKRVWSECDLQRVVALCFAFCSVSYWGTTSGMDTTPKAAKSKARKNKTGPDQKECACSHMLSSCIFSILLHSFACCPCPLCRRKPGLCNL